jgi:hypothetical protein
LKKGITLKINDEGKFIVCVVRDITILKIAIETRAYSEIFIYFLLV